MPDDREILNEMLERLVEMEDKLGKIKSDANARAILERLRKVRMSVLEVLEKMKTK